MFGHPIIAALRRAEDLPRAVESPVRAVFLMYGEVCGFEKVVSALNRAGKEVYIHIDLIKGLSADREAVQYIAERSAPRGIVTTKGHLIKEARKFGLAAVHQFFIIDTQAFNTAIKSVTTSNPDAVELMPGLMPRVIREWKAAVNLPLVVAGLVRSPDEVQALLSSGCQAVAAGEPSLWGTLP